MLNCREIISYPFGECACCKKIPFRTCKNRRPSIAQDLLLFTSTHAKSAFTPLCIEFENCMTPSLHIGCNIIPTAYLFLTRNQLVHHDVSQKPCTTTNIPYLLNPLSMRVYRRMSITYYHSEQYSGQFSLTDIRYQHPIAQGTVPHCDVSYDETRMGLIVHPVVPICITKFMHHLMGR